MITLRVIVTGVHSEKVINDYVDEWVKNAQKLLYTPSSMLLATV